MAREREVAEGELVGETSGFWREEERYDEYGIMEEG